MFTEVIIVLAMLAVNAVFAAYEMALASVSRARLEALVQLGRRGARSAVHMKGRLERSLAVVQVGITMAGAIAAATGGAGVDEYLAPWLAQHFGLAEATAELLAVVLFVLPLSAFTIVFAELVPKLFALNNKETVALALSPLMRGVAGVLYPAVSILELAVKRIMSLGGERRKAAAGRPDEQLGLLELRAAASLARASRAIGELEERIVGSAAELSVRTVREVMLPVGEIAVIPESMPLADTLVFAHLHMHTRYPTCAEADRPQEITGYVNFKDIIATLRISPGTRGLKGIVRPILRLDAGTTLARALERMMRDNAHIAVGTGPDGEVAGLLTLEDVVEQLVGHIGDEYDRLPTHVQPLAKGWIVGGGAPMAEVYRATAVSPDADAGAPRTLADWCEEHRKNALENDQVLRSGRLEVRVRKLRRHRLMEAVVQRVDPVVEEGGE